MSGVKSLAGSSVVIRAWIEEPVTLISSWRSPISSKDFPSATPICALTKSTLRVNKVQVTFQEINLITCDNEHDNYISQLLHTRKRCDVKSNCKMYHCVSAYLEKLLQTAHKISDFMISAGNIRVNSKHWKMLSLWNGNKCLKTAWDRVSTPYLNVNNQLLLLKERLRHDCKMNTELCYQCV